MNSLKPRPKASPTTATTKNKTKPKVATPRRKSSRKAPKPKEDASDDERTEGEEGEQSEDSESSETDMYDGEDDGEEMAETPEPWRPNYNVLDNPEAFGYKVFSKASDEEIDAEDLSTPDELERLRTFLDKELKNLSSAVSRLANKLQRKLLAQQNRSWDFDLEEGVLDPARLPRVIIDPTSALSFKRERDTDFKDTVVTLLIDNSGSMRGRPIMVAACCADILARTLERCGVKVEILGFTTQSVEGRTSPRRRGSRRWQAADPGPPQRSPPHHLQGRRRPDGAAPSAAISA